MATPGPRLRTSAGRLYHGDAKGLRPPTGRLDDGRLEMKTTIALFAVVGLVAAAFSWIMEGATGFDPKECHALQARYPQEVVCR